MTCLRSGETLTEVMCLAGSEMFLTSPLQTEYKALRTLESRSATNRTLEVLPSKPFTALPSSTSTSDTLQFSPSVRRFSTEPS